MTVTVTFEKDLFVPDKEGRMQPQGDRLIIRTPFSMKDLIKGEDGHPGLPGRRWAPNLKAWHIPSTPESAAALMRLLDEREIGASLDQPTLDLFAQAERSIEAQAFKTAADLPEIPGRYCQCDNGPTLYKYDEAAGTEDSQGICEICRRAVASWLHQRQGFYWSEPRLGALLAMDMGTAKSKVAIALADRDMASSMIVVAPPRACKIWPKQFRLHSARQWETANHGGLYERGPNKGKPRWFGSMRQRIEVAERAERHARLHNRPFCFIVNYEAAWQEPLRSWILEREWDVAVCDESHKIKSPGGKWSQFCERLSHKSRRRLALTGTPMPHSELDIYAQARFIDPGVFGTSFQAFKARYFEFGGFEGRALQRDNGFDGFKSAEARVEFLDKLAGMSFFVESDDVLDLPPQLDQPSALITLGDEPRRHYRELLEDWQTQIGDADEDEPLIVQNALSQMVRLSQVTSGHLPHDVMVDPGDADRPVQMEREVVVIGHEKAEALADVLDDIGRKTRAGKIAHGEFEPVVVFARFVHDLTEIRKVAEAAGRRYKEVSGRRADGLDDDGRMVEDCDLVGVQQQAGGTGVDLTRARYCVFYSLDFNLGDHSQARKRVHRPGQKHPVTYVYIVVDDTIDVAIRRALRERQSIVGAVIRAVKSGVYGSLDELDEAA